MPGKRKAAGEGDKGGAQQRYSLAFYDALIVAAALEAGCTRLLSEDLQHGLRIDRLTIENPFRS